MVLKATNDVLYRQYNLITLFIWFGKRKMLIFAIIHFIAIQDSHSSVYSLSHFVSCTQITLYFHYLKTKVEILLFVYRVHVN